MRCAPLYLFIACCLVVFLCISEISGKQVSRTCSQAKILDCKYSATGAIRTYAPRMSVQPCPLESRDFTVSRVGFDHDCEIKVRFGNLTGNINANALGLQDVFPAGA